MPILEGIEHFESKLRDLALTVQRKALLGATRKGAELIRAKAAELAPRLSGKLADMEITKLATAQNSATEITIQIGPARSAFYGVFDEFGTAHMTAQPFLQPAFDSTVDEAIEVASREFRAAIEEVSE